MAALQASLSLSSSSSFFGQRLSSPGIASLAAVDKAERTCLVFSRLKRWELKKFKPNSLPVLHKMHIKSCGTVKVPVHSSNVMLYSKDKEVASWVEHKILDDRRRVRYLIKTGEIIDSAENWKNLKESKGKTKMSATS